MRVRAHVPAVAIVLAAALALHCGSNEPPDPGTFPTGDATPPPTATTEGGTPPVFPEAGSSFTDFPAAPSIDPSLPGDIDKQFGAPSVGEAGAGAAPCITEPADDAMIPKNWT
ncbi:MAG: hypothetical protein JNM74_20170, partial [Myxococcales bacterium]|nr:hypothetical protein [Myxococcales bacterium]